MIFGSDRIYVFPHEHNSLHFTLSSQTLTDLVHLLRGNIVDGTDEDTLVSGTRSVSKEHYYIDGLCLLFKQRLELVWLN